MSSGCRIGVLLTQQDSHGGTDLSSTGPQGPINMHQASSDNNANSLMASSVLAPSMQLLFKDLLFKDLLFMDLQF